MAGCTKKSIKRWQLYLPVDAVITAIFKQMHPTELGILLVLIALLRNIIKETISRYGMTSGFGFFNQKVVKKKKSIWMEWKQILGDETDR